MYQIRCTLSEFEVWQTGLYTPFTYFVCVMSKITLHLGPCDEVQLSHEVPSGLDPQTYLPLS